jgi:hypothetical protein
MENSGEQERTYLFSLSSGFRMGSVFVGSWLGGYMPSWVASFKGISPTDSSAYGSALLAVSLFAVLGFLPLLFIRSKKRPLAGKYSRTPAAARSIR